MRFLRTCLASGLVAGMLSLVGCTTKEEPATGGGSGTPPASPSDPAKKTGFACEKCKKTSETAVECCGAMMKKVGA